MDAGLRTTRPPETSAEIEAGRFYILSGQKAYVAEVGEQFKQDYGNWDARPYLVFDRCTLEIRLFSLITLPVFDCASAIAIIMA